MRVRIIATRRAPAAIRDLIFPTLRAHRPTITVERRQIPYWQERGWIRDGDTYTGSYQTRHGSFRGAVADRGFGNVEFFLYQPSDAIRNHSHWVCFQHRDNDWYLIHMGRRPKDVSSGILTIERLITEAYES